MMVNLKKTNSFSETPKKYTPLTIQKNINIMKSIIIYILCLLIYNFSIQAQNIDCAKFKTGKFYYPELEDKYSIRSESIQESYNHGKLEMIWKVKWLNGCEYELTCIKVLVKPYPIFKGDKMHATIIQTDGECFTTKIIFYNKEYPKGQTFPQAQMCIAK